MNVRSVVTVAVTAISSFLIEPRLASADAAFHERITDSTYWHHYVPIYTDSDARTRRSRPARPSAAARALAVAAGGPGR